MRKIPKKALEKQLEDGRTKVLKNGEHFVTRKFIILNSSELAESDCLIKNIALQWSE